MTLKMLRYTVGRWLVHCGLRVMPPGASRAELTDIFWQWRRHVTVQVRATGRAEEHDRAVQIARRWRDRARRIAD